MELGVISLSDLQADPETGRPIAAVDRLDDTVAYARLADRLGVDVFALGEHHSPQFAVSSPAVALAAIAGQTETIRLTSGVTVLSTLDPVRVYQDFAQLDLVSHGRAEITAGRSAFLEPFALFGAPIDEYDQLFAEKLDLLLRLREHERITWSTSIAPPARQPATPTSSRSVSPPTSTPPLPSTTPMTSSPTTANTYDPRPPAAAASTSTNTPSPPAAAATAR
jgi:alkanesulfonate monooxygenase SsuD/methylene tetrahydromethanopterin reductase-like flavin-dependent oxidoreductase (luciferase family)